MFASGHRSIASWILHRPLAAYLLLTFLIAWVFWVPLAVLFHGGWDLESLLANPLVIALQTAGVTAPLISAFVVTRVTRGRGTAGRLLEGLKRWGVGPWWYAAACLLVPVLTTIGLAVRATMGIEPVVPRGSAFAVMLTDIGWVGVVLTYPLQLLGQCFGSPLLEEPGWRGFAFPRLQQRMPAAIAAVLVGAIWGLWHLPLFIALHENLPVTLTLIILHGFILGWLYANTGSLLLVVFGHASLSVANNSLSLPDQGIIQVTLTLGACAVILIFSRFTDLAPRLGRNAATRGPRVDTRFRLPGRRGTGAYAGPEGRAGLEPASRSS